MERFVIRMGRADSEQLASRVITRADLATLNDVLELLVNRPILDVRARAALAPIQELAADAAKR